MKYKAMSYNHGQSIKDQIVKKFRECGFISLGDAKEIAGDYAHKEDKYTGWDDESDLDRKIRVREIKSGWFVYLPEPNAVIKIGESPFIEENHEAKNLFDIIDRNNEEVNKQFREELEALENIEVAINNGMANLRAVVFDCFSQNGYIIRPCIVKAAKSGPKEKRQDRKAKFHRWADLSKGVQQVVALVEFEDGHVEQVQPDRVIFQEVKDND